MAANVDGIFCTDVSNASRWLFLDIHNVLWDQRLIDIICFPHKISLSSLPQVNPSSHIYSIMSKDCGISSFDNVPLAGVLGDQQAALFGQCAFEPGEAKNTYGTGLFLMMNTGSSIIPSTHGLLTTIAYQVKESSIVYALEGSVSHSGSTLQWLRDQLQIIDDFPDAERLATEHNDGLYFVPAFSGLFAPHWRSDARGCIVGMTATHHRGHICRAALEATAYQAKEVFDAIYADSSVHLKALKVDGGGTASQLLMQFQADCIGVPVIKPLVQETTAIGAAFAAGLAIGLWKDLNEIRELWHIAKIWTPQMPKDERDKNWHGWQKAVTKSMGWVDEDDNVVTNPDERARPLQIESNGCGTKVVFAVGAAALVIGLVIGTRTACIF
jgi:glycerol kinase